MMLYFGFYVYVYMNVCMDVFIYLLYLCVCIPIYYNICMSALHVGIMYVSKLSI